ncbi:glucosamine-6-phosphate deaminase [Ferroacidibacillus organovorans]|uniref:Glucosamine-6-phosphate deaminase n=1 Tax=Ferroacidibacillus organovorans TaxID=1765683 RepID=A0A101XPV5_9BACL|nr:glucosamine-6-phosphate deaminase [Ferroacidibacillus organovorans]KUO95352.1 glucosamine-6-phosphate deaminase [Ferroacidibacillus organovorans]
MNIRVFENPQMAAVYAAALVEQVIQSVRNPVLGLATGSTPIPLYESLVSFHRQGLSFAHVTTLNLDEYVGLSADHPQSYHHFMNEHLFRHVDLPAEKRFLPNGAAPDLALECERYDQIIREHPIDLQILGIGLNGHIGFNEPDVALKANTHVVTLARDTIEANARFFGEQERVPTEAITMGLQPILMAKKVLLLAFGREKANAVLSAVRGDVRTYSPASILQVHPNVTFILDREAAHILEA